METKEKIQGHREEFIDFRSFFFKLIQNWYFIALSVAVALFIAHYYIQYKQPIYKVAATMLIKDEKGMLFMEQGLYRPQLNLNNEIGILSSRKLAERTIRGLDFQVSYYRQGRFRLTELYKNIPFSVHWDTAHAQLANIPFHVDFLTNDRLVVSVNGDDDMFLYDYSTDQDYAVPNPKAFQFSKEVRLGEPVVHDYFSFTITRNPDLLEMDLRNLNYQFRFNAISSLINEYNTVSISPIDNESSIIKIALTSPVFHKAISYVNELCEVYLQNDLEYINRKSLSTIEFIDLQLSELQDSIGFIQRELQSIRTNNMVDIDAELKSSYTRMDEIRREKATEEVKVRYYNFLLDYLDRDLTDQDIVAPSSMGINDAVLNRLVMELNQLIVERQSMLQTLPAENPRVINHKAKVDMTRQTLRHTINNMLQLSDIQISTLDSRITETRREINRLPAAEGLLHNVQRDYQVNDQIFTYLKEKRAEAAISLASNTSNHQVIDQAMFIEKVSPKEGFIRMVASVAGLMFPILLILMGDIFNNKITSRADIEEYTQVPILGFIIHNDDPDDSTVVVNKPNSTVAESLRSIRTNLKYFKTPYDSTVISITSSVSGEGKTFCSVNLASIFAISGKRTVLVSCDLRKPKVLTEFNIANTERGLTAFLIGRNTLDEVVVESGHNNLTLIPSGPVPPNPAELLESQSMADLISELRSRYDYIVVDTSPVGLVSDALQIMKLADISLFVVRQNYSVKSSIMLVNDIVDMTGAKNMGIIVNDVNINKKGYGHYFKGKYGYGYGYGYGNYHADTVKKGGGLWSRLFGRKKR